MTEPIDRRMRSRAKPRPGEPIKIIKDGTGWTRYQAVVTTTPPGVKRRQARRHFDTLAQARDFVARTRAEVREGRYRQPQPTTLQQLTDMWAASKDDVRRITVDGYLQAVAAVLRDHGGRRVHDIERAEIVAWKAAWPTSGGLRGRGLSRRSIELSLQVLRMIFDYGIVLKLIIENPAAGVQPPRETLADEKKAATRKMTATVWSFPELRRFVAAAEDTKLAAAMRLSACGLRRSEILGLDWENVDLEAATIDVVQGRVREIEKVKSKRSRRTVAVDAMIPGTRQALLELWLAQGKPTAGLVVLDADGDPYDPDLYSRAFRTIARSAGLPAVHLHSLRHSIASELHRRGVAPAVGARLLGHSLQTHLSRYVMATDEHLDEAAVAFGAAWEGAA